MDYLSQIPHLFTDYLITLALSLLIGFEQRKRHDEKNENPNEKSLPTFGTDRSFAFIGTLGFIFYAIAMPGLILFITGAIILSVFLAVFYWQKINDMETYGLTSILVALITYSLGPLIISQPKWLSVLIVVSVLILVERKEFFKKISGKINSEEFPTLAKFLIVAAVILPIVPKDTPIPVLNLTPYSIWITVVVVSAISYASYLLQTYFFKKAGVILTGILGGIGSSTATTIIISKRSREQKSRTGIYAASIIFSNAMTYIKVLVLMFIFNYPLAIKMLPYFAGLVVTASVLGIGIYLKNKPKQKDMVQAVNTNPLELKVSLLFAGLFVLFSVVTSYTVSHFGSAGLNVLSFITGVTDITPFLLNIFQGKYELPLETLGRTALQAIISNNILKSVYILSFAEKTTKIWGGIAMGIITVITAIFAFLTEVIK